MLKVLDHGYVRMITSWGSDEAIVEAARMSVQKGFVSWAPYEGHPKGDLGLLDYLMQNGHHTPFEMAGLQVEVQAPIMVFREWHRHRTQSYNEASARYAPLPELDYVPHIERVMRNAGGTNKQAGTIQGSEVLTEATALEWLESLESHYSRANELYQWALSKGIPKELARLSMPVGHYSKMRAQANLRNWLGFIALRDHPAAQFEIQLYAKAVRQILYTLFPKSMGLFDVTNGKAK